MGMLIADVSGQRLCLISILLLVCLGVWAGFGTSVGRYSEMWEPVMAARYARDLPRSRLPRLPRGMLLGMLFGTIPLFKGWCPKFLVHHQFFTISGICCILSTAAWLLWATFFLVVTDNKRA